jgi:hypothetical protein
MQTACDITNGERLPVRLPKGFVIGDHVVDGWLRDGGMAAIYRAHRASDARCVALKLQLPSTAHDPSIRARFDREAEVMRRVNGSPHVVELFDAGVLDDGRRYFVMEWVEGDNLEELLDFSRNQDRRLSIVRACRIGRDVARGLAEAHRHGVVHLDLKPANVMVGQGAAGTDVIKLVDFGIAADLREAEARTDGASDSIVMGTSGYMPPEQVHGHAASPSFDLYALGVLLFESLSGSCAPPTGWTPETLPPLETLRRGVPTALTELVRSCMDFDPARRPASAGQVASELVEIIEALEAEHGRSVVGRSGGTEVVLRSSMPRAATEPEAPVRTGGTEVALTHDEALLCADVGPVLVDDAMSEAWSSEPWKRPWRRRWAMLGVASLVVAGIWFERGDGRDGALADPPVGVSLQRDAEDRTSGSIDESRAGDVAALASSGSERSRASKEERGAARRSRKRGGARQAGASSALCGSKREEAVDAKGRRSWPELLRITTSTSCWATSRQRLERKRLRVQAYAELGAYTKCVDEGGRISDAEIQQRARFCRAQLAG